MRRIVPPLLFGAFLFVAACEGSEGAPGEEPGETPPPGTPDAPPPMPASEGDGGPISGGDHDPCDGELACRRFVFVTAGTVPGSFGEGLRSAQARANDICDEAATRIDLLRGRSFEAWLSIGDPAQSVKLQLVNGTAPYILLDGTVVASSFEELTSGRLKHAIDRSEANERVEGRVWTGTGTDAEPAAPNCSDWTSSAGEGRAGETASADAAWTFGAPLPCTAQAHLYCLEF